MKDTLNFCSLARKAPKTGYVLRCCFSGDVMRPASALEVEAAKDDPESIITRNGWNYYVAKETSA